MFFRKKNQKSGSAMEKKTYDPAVQRPVLKCSICNGEKVVAFQDIRTGQCEEVMFIRSEEDLRQFRQQYGIEGEIKKIY